MVNGRFRRPRFPTSLIFEAPLVPLKIQCFSNGKAPFQSFFMSITVHLFTAAGVQRCIETAEVRLFVVGETYIGRSTHSVPSLSKFATRSAGATKSGPPALVTRPTSFTIACFGGVAFHDGNGSP
jgi:hypothetical protein